MRRKVGPRGGRTGNIRGFGSVMRRVASALPWGSESAVAALAAVLTPETGSSVDTGSPADTVVAGEADPNRGS